VVGALWLALAGCGEDLPPPPSADTAEAASAPALAPLPAPALLRRLSLDLRGTLPSAEALDAVEADPDALSGYRDAYLEDPALEERLVLLLAERWHTRIDDFTARHFDFGLPDDREYAFERAVGEEPLRLMARVVAEDLPWTEVVTADWTMADDTLLEIWPLAALEDGEDGAASGWRPAAWTDGRPAAGVLSSNGLWWRYYTTESNQNRARVAALSRLLLCVDFLSRPVSFSDSPALVDAGGTEDALRDDPYCLGCHSAIEPMASALFGFWTPLPESAWEMTEYHAEREPLGEVLLGVDPGFFGEPVEGLWGLGQAIAADSRFPTCAARSFAEALWDREAALEDYAALEALRQVLVEEELRVKPLLAAITDTEAYRMGEGSDEAAPTRRMLSPDQLAGVVEDLTGFAWTWEGAALMDEDEAGFRVLAGGVDGVQVARPQADPGLTWALVVERLGQAAADYAVQRELVEGGERRLFSAVELADGPGDEGFEAELAGLTWRLWGRRAGAEELAALAALWSAAEAIGGAEAAWTVTVSALLRDPETVSY
jgi:hypothetical protein